MNVVRILLCTAALLGGPVAGGEEGLRVTGQRLFVPVEIEGTSVEALLDTGAEMTLRSPNASGSRCRARKRRAAPAAGRRCGLRRMWTWWWPTWPSTT
jgi:hypothetical protein